VNTMNMTRATVTRTTTLAPAREEFRALNALVTGYDRMSLSEQRNFDRRLGAWMLRADITTDATLDEDVRNMRLAMAKGDRWLRLSSRTALALKF
jgi:hypothetical protein